MLPGWTITNKYIDYADFVYFDGAELSNRKSYAVKARLKPQLDAHNLYDKALLHDHLSALAPEIICKTMGVTADSVIPPGVWIIRANTGWAGSD
jgi:hypothetical protein